MASTATEVCNLALDQLRITKQIGNLDSDTSIEAKVMKRLYELHRDRTLRAFSWPFATKYVDLDLVETDPNSEWKYAYRVPADCMYFRRILSGSRRDTKESRVPFKQAGDGSGGLIFTDQADAQGEYTVKITNVGIFPSDFVSALALRLAGFAAPALTGGDKEKLGARAFQLYQFEISDAEASAGNEEAPDVDPDSDLIRGRMGG